MSCRQSFMKVIRAAKKPKIIYVVGQKDPRGPDNSIKIFIDDKGRLVIEIEKPGLRCYPFSHIEETASHVRIIQNK